MKTPLNFRPELIKAFDLMIRGINVTLSDKGKYKIIAFKKKENQYKQTSDRWWVIQSINCDETINICSNTHEIWNNVNLDYIKL